MDEAALTPKREKFCLAFVETGNASEAYRIAFNTTNALPKTINENACRLLAGSKVKARVAELQAEHTKRHEITIDKLRDMLLEDRTFARDLESPASAVSATEKLGKLYGLFTDKTEINANVTVNIARLVSE